MGLSKWLVENLIPVDLREPSASQHELAPGIVKPSYALAGMVAAHILKHADKVTGNRLELTSRERYEYLYGSVRKAEFSDEKMTVNVSVAYKDVKKGPGYKYVEEARSVEVRFKRNKSFSFDDSDQLLIVNAMKKATTISAEMVRAKKLEEVQKVACDIIEELFGPPIKDDNVASTGTIQPTILPNLGDAEVGDDLWSDTEEARPEVKGTSRRAGVSSPRSSKARKSWKADKDVTPAEMNAKFAEDVRDISGLDPGGSCRENPRIVNGRERRLIRESEDAAEYSDFDITD